MSRRTARRLAWGSLAVTCLFGAAAIPLFADAGPPAPNAPTTNMADGLAALDGDLEVRSERGRDTTVVGRLPVGAMVPAG